MSRSEPSPGSTARARDPRPARTRDAILGAIAALSTAEQELTVAAVSARAGVSRSTFYAQFRDLDDVAIQLVRELYAEIESLDRRLRGSSSPLEVTRLTTGMIIAEFERRRPLYAAVLGHGVSGEAHRSLQSIFAAGALSTMLRVAPTHIDAEFAAAYTAAGVLGAITDWLLDERPCPGEELRERLLAMLPRWIVGE